MKPAFSTVALPDWTLPRLAERAETWGFLGVELRTFGFGSTQIACDPALTAPAKTRAMFTKSGVSMLSLATSIRYDEPITPPVIGRLLDTEKPVRETAGAVDLAVQLECPLVRVFGFEIEGSESRKSAVARIVERLVRSADHCDKSGVRLMIENGGSFPRAADLAELIDRVGSPLVCAAYSLAVGAAAGERAEDAANVLGERLVCAKVRDFKNSAPCALGEGDLRCRETVERLARSGFGGWLVYEYDRIWFHDTEEPDAVLSRSAKRLFEWVGSTISPASRERTAV
ncbi:hypothetical protein PHYC_03433 [Phycisphaerales bacterium]|nr:hypothetical protein PHYC_03433 [Phycisphaerales bacterium]